jgi:hypothetical protein
MADQKPISEEGQTLRSAASQPDPDAYQVMGQKPSRADPEAVARYVAMALDVCDILVAFVVIGRRYATDRDLDVVRRLDAMGIGPTKLRSLLEEEARLPEAVKGVLTEVRGGRIAEWGALSAPSWSEAALDSGRSALASADLLAKKAPADRRPTVLLTELARYCELVFRPEDLLRVRAQIQTEGRLAA